MSRKKILLTKSCLFLKALRKNYQNFNDKTLDFFFILKIKKSSVDEPEQHDGSKLTVDSLIDAINQHQ